MAVLDLSNKKAFYSNLPQKIKSNKGLPFLIPSLILATLLVGFGTLFLFANKIEPSSNLNVTPYDLASLNANYNQNKELLERQRSDLLKQYKQASSREKKEEILAKASELLTKTLEEKFFPLWLGTPYDFNGIAQTPHSGPVACGYFVAAVLAEAGFKFDRFFLGQMPAEKIITSFINKANIWRFSHKTGPEFLKLIEEYPDGLYLLGLDTHIGFLIKKGLKISFIHASRLPPYGVRQEEARQSASLLNSNYRALGYLNDIHTFIPNWLLGKEINLKN